MCLRDRYVHIYHVSTFVLFAPLSYTTLKPSWNPAGVEPGNQEGPGC